MTTSFVKCWTKWKANKSTGKTFEIFPRLFPYILTTRQTVTSLLHILKLDLCILYIYSLNLLLQRPKSTLLYFWDFFSNGVAPNRSAKVKKIFWKKYDFSICDLVLIVQPPIHSIFITLFFRFLDQNNFFSS